MALSYAKFYKPLMMARIPDGAKIVLVSLLDFQQLGVNPKIDTLAKATGRCSRAVDNALARLREIGLIQVQWGQRESVYRITPMEEWPRILGILKRTSCVSEPNPETHIVRNKKRTSCVSEPPAPYLVQDSSLRQGNGAAADLESRTRESGGGAAALTLQLLENHPEPQPKGAAAEVKKALARASPEEILRRHKLWCDYWGEYHPRFVPWLARWFYDGDWLRTPRKPAQALTRAERIKAEILAKGQHA